ncbi:MAG: archaellin/type IV pilin N-terminal domain-containing protein [Candidatus Bathyarchaeales archaeon]
MHAKSIIKSKKAISPILATLLLIVIAVAAIVVTYAWIMTYMSSARQQGGVILTKDAVSWPSGKIIIYVRNIGTSDGTISAVYVGTSATNLSLVSDVIFNPTNAVAKADGGVVQIDLTYNWQNDTRYYFKVVPTTGTPLEFNEKSP